MSCLQRIRITKRGAVRLTLISIKTIIHFSCSYAICPASALLIPLSGVEGGVTYTARSASFVDVKSVVSSASDGDTVVIPPGTDSWTQTLSVAKGITIQGATTVTGDHTMTMRANDQTIILDDVPIARSGHAVILSFECNVGQSGRISGITFRAGTRPTTPGLGGVVLSGTSNQFRVDHCHFDNLHAVNMNIYGSIYGVIDHCIFSESNFNSAIFISNGGGTYGDSSWAAATQFGSANFMFAEDCEFSWTGDAKTQNACSIDCYNGGRYVARYSTFNQAKPNSHGTESGGRSRSARAIEIYNNIFNWAAGVGPTGGQLRGGCLLIHENIYHNYGSGYCLRVYREFFPFNVWGGAFGTNAWDSNDPHGVYASGIHSGANGATALTKTGAGWTINQWVGYSVLNTMTGRGSYITSNTRDTITYALSDGFGNGPNLAFNTGDGFEIRKVLIALDQPGRGRGDLITGDPPNVVNTMTRTKAWPHQALEPVYSWNNTNNGSNINIGSYGEPTLKEGRDYYDNTPKPGYTPYVYPHPLTRGLPPPEQTTRNTTGNSQDDQHKKRRPWGGRKSERKKAKESKESSTNEMAEGQENVGN